MNSLNPNNDSLRIEALNFAVRAMTGPELPSQTINRAKVYYGFLTGQPEAVNS